MDEKFTSGGRKKLLIHPRFQAFFLLWVMGVSTLLCVALYIFSAVVFARLRDLGVGMALPADHALMTYLVAKQQTLKLLFGGCLVAAFIAYWFIGIFFSHRLSGPVFRLNHALRELSINGNTDPLHFREKDFFPELADSFNDVRSRVVETQKPRG